MNNLAGYVKHTLEKSQDRYAIPVYGGVYHLATYFDEYGFSCEKMADCLVNTIENAKFFCPHRKPSKIARTFSHLLMIDPHLLELYLGFSLSELDEHYVKCYN